jgi:HTH-type transcriptional regulator/antitoxin HigA
MKPASLLYTVIKSPAQYRKYVSRLEELDNIKPGKERHRDEIDLLLLLIKTWDQEHNTFSDVDPIMLIRALMEERQIKASHIAAASGYSKGLISDILNYKKGMSKELIRFFAGYFKLSQESLNRPYDLDTKPVASKVAKGPVARRRSQSWRKLSGKV